MKISTLLFFVGILQVAAKGNAQNISITVKNMPLEKIFREIKKQSGYVFFYNSTILKFTKPVTLSEKNVGVEEVLSICLKGQHLDYYIENKTIVITQQKEENAARKMIAPDIIQKTVAGIITNDKGEPLEGVSIIIKGTNEGVRSANDGSFSIEAKENSVLIFTFVGYEKQEIKVTSTSFLNVKLTLAQSQIAEVVIKGIRGSQYRANNIKKRADQFVDAITSEDVGKLPDANIAEALQRVPGVAIQRNRGQGDFVSIRGLGPQFVRGSINGRTLVSGTEEYNTTISGGLQSSTGRETNFDILPSEVIETMEVFKSGTADQVEGGIGGVVNIKTAKPLKLGKKFSLGFRNDYNGFGNKNSPNAYGLASFVNKKKNFGALTTLAWSQRNIRQDIADGFGYAPEGLFGSPDFFDTDGDGKGNAKGVLFPFSSNMESFNEQRKRLTASVTFQWAPSKNTEIILDALYTKRNLVHNETQYILFGQPFGSGNNGTTNPDGSVQWPGLMINANNTAVNYSSTKSVEDAGVLNRQKTNDDIINTGLNIKHKIKDWELNFDASYSGAKGTMGYKGGVFGYDFTAPVLVNTTINSNFITVNPLSSASTDINHITTRNASATDRTNKDREYASLLDATKTLKSNIFSSLKFGVRYSGREKDISVYQFGGFLQDASGNNVKLQVVNDKVPYQHGVSDFLNGNFPVDYSKFIFPASINSFFDALENAGGTYKQPYYPNGSYNIKENSIAAYGQINLKGKIGDVPFTGNVGVRVVNTFMKVTSYIQKFKIVQTNTGGLLIGSPVATGGDSSIFNNSSNFNVLPSANIKFEIASNTFLRAAYSKSLTRPLFSDLGGLDVNFTNFFVNHYGNPDLKPYQSDNYDIGFEWYTPGGGLVATNFFYKKLNSFITNVTTNNVDFLGVTYRSFSQPQNQSGGNIMGTELTYQQPFNFLHGAWSGFGIIANLTMADGQLFQTNGITSAFPGVSRYSMNTALYYDKGGKFQARLAYTLRDKFLMMPSDVFAQEIWIAKYGQLDASASYDILKNLHVVVEAINLNNEKEKRFSSNQASPALNGSRPLSYGYLGTRFGIGLRFSL